MTETKLACINCGKNLAEIVTTQTNDELKEIGERPIFASYSIVNCPNCKKGKSKSSGIITGRSYIGPLMAGVSVEIENTDIDDNGTIINEVKLV